MQGIIKKTANRSFQNVAKIKISGNKSKKKLKIVFKRKLRDE
jgi:hypothetical protein